MKRRELTFVGVDRDSAIRRTGDDDETELVRSPGDRVYC
jgi:hypothetical protein